MFIGNVHELLPGCTVHIPEDSLGTCLSHLRGVSGITRINKLNVHIAVVWVTTLS
jgi:hypothetical protein